jgi:hypothetical protein
MPADPPPRTISTSWRRVAAAVTGIALLAGVGVLSWRDGYAVGAASRPVTDEDVAAKCRERYLFSGPQLTGEPVQRFVMRDGNNQARVYVSEADNWMIVCRKDSLGVRAMGTQMEQGAKDRIQLFGAEDAVLKSNLVVGRVPRGTTTIQARLVSGRVVTGSHDSDVFVIWAADDSVRGAQLTATRADGSVIAVASAPADF